MMSFQLAYLVELSELVDVLAHCVLAHIQRLADGFVAWPAPVTSSVLTTHEKTVHRQLAGAQSYLQNFIWQGEVSLRFGPFTEWR